MTFPCHPSGSRRNQHLELGVSQDRLRPGWVLIRGLLDYQGQNLEANLITEDRQGNCRRFALPVTLKGTLLELVYLPRGVHHAWLELGSEEPVSCAGPIALEPVGLLTSRVLMWRRTVSMLLKTPRRQRRVQGLTWASVLFNPRKAYGIAAKLRHVAGSPPYPDWIALNEQHTAADRRRLTHKIKKYALRQCRFAVLIDAREHHALATLLATLASLGRQLEIPFRPWVLTSGEHHPELEEQLQGRAMVLEVEKLPALLESCSWVLMLAPGTELAPWTLAWMAIEAQHAGTRLIYPDHDYLIGGRRINPQFKPDWSEELARASDYVGDTFAVHADLLREVLLQSGFESAFRLMLASVALAGPSAVRHIPAVLCHQLYRPSRAAANKQALEQHLGQLGVEAEVEQLGDHLRVRYQLPEPKPRVSIVIPTRDALCYLKTCVESVLEKTSWPDFELLLVDNQSRDARALAYLETLGHDPRIRVVRYDHPFNFSAINNHAARLAKGEVLCLLNNDTEVISPDWLEEMVSRLLQPGVGVVGARLYFSNGRVQHAGDVLGPGGCAAHLHGVLDAEDPGYMHRAILPQDLSAVTAACLVTRRALYQRLGGLDADNLPVAFNDVDYCLRAREAGWRVLYTPYAELYHHESVSRGKDDHPERRARAKREAEYMRKRWAHVIERDPFYNPNLNYAQPDFRLGKVPRVGWPW